MHLMGRRRDEAAAASGAGQFAALAAFLDDLDGRVELGAVVEAAAEHVRRLLGADAAWIVLRDSACEEISPVSSEISGPGGSEGDRAEAALHVVLPIGGEDGCVAVLELTFGGRTGLDDASRQVLAIVVPAIASAIRRVKAQELCSSDADERHAAEDALAASERRFRSLVQHASELFVVFDRSGAPSYVSSASERILGLTAEQMLGAWPDMIHSDDRFAVGREFRAINAGKRTALVELRARRGDGSWRTLEGTLTNLLEDPDVGGIVANLRDVTEQSRIVAELTRRTFYDPLTQLPNRTHLLDRLEVALGTVREGSPMVALLIVDLDQFGVVNDSLGHATGDALLLGLAHRLRAGVPREMLLARIGGDELAVLDAGCTSPDAATVLGDQIAEMLREPFHLTGREVCVTASIGIAVGDAADVVAEDLMREADTALNRAKRNGRNHVQLFDEEMRAWSLARLEGEQELRRALERGELRVLFQPELWLRSGALAGLEALVAWQHPERGLLNAGQFIDLAEESGLVVPLSEWVLFEACRQAKRWSERRGEEQAVPVSVNISARQLDRPDLPGVVARALATTGLDPRLLWLEITESALIENPAHVIEMLHALHELGITIAVDDFGTGYSSLLYLRQLPVDVLKVDRIFVDGLGRDAQDTAIVSSVIELGHAFGLLVVAEGVERLEQLEAVSDLGCDIGQGYHWARPMTATALEEWWSAFSPAPPTPAPAGPVVTYTPSARGGDGRVEGYAEMHRFVLEATRAVLRAECTEEVVGIAMALVRGLGGWTGPPRVADARMMPIDLSFGVGEPLFAAAEQGSVARARIERVLPEFVADARHLVARLAEFPTPPSGVIDHVTGLIAPRSFEQLLPRLRAGDAVVLIDLGVARSPARRDDGDEPDLVLRSFSRVLRTQAQVSDRCALVDDAVFAVMMAATDAEGAAVLVERLRDEWRRVRPRPAPIAAGLAHVGADGVAVAVGRARQAMEAAKQAGDELIQVAETLGA